MTLPLNYKDKREQRGWYEWKTKGKIDFVSKLNALN